MALHPTGPAQPAVLDVQANSPAGTQSSCPASQPCDCPSGSCDSFGRKFLNFFVTPVTCLNGPHQAPCPRNSIDQAGLAKPADTLEGAAARIQKDTAEARSRRDKVCFLATVDWDRYPEAEKALALALRTDPSESVRLQAAGALANGWVHLPETIQALTLTANASDKDGNPGEKSELVRRVATTALIHCRSQAAAPPTAKLPRPGPVDEGLLEVLQTQYQEIHPAALKPPVPSQTSSSAKTGVSSEPNTGKRGLFDLIGRAFGQGQQSKPHPADAPPAQP